MSILRFISALFLSVLALSAGVSAQGGQQAKGKTYTVHIKGFEFTPEILEVSRGDTVVWMNDDIVPHTATAKGAFDSKGLTHGRSWSYVANKTGTHPYICSYHPTMKGELVVK